MRALPILEGFLAATSALAAARHESDGMLVDEHGMTLYEFDGKEKPDAKSCEGDCARNFPPALAAPGDRPSGALLPTSGKLQLSRFANVGLRESRMVEVGQRRTR
jgi:predicted lipoprotein with Yx(FWY)xxD motif